jgi:hypothetical protein
VYGVVAAKNAGAGKNVGAEEKIRAAEARMREQE